MAGRLRQMTTVIQVRDEELALAGGHHGVFLGVDLPSWLWALLTDVPCDLTWPPYSGPQFPHRINESWWSLRGFLFSSCFLYSCACVGAQLLSYVQLCNPVDCSPPGSSVHGVLQERILEWVAISSSRGSSQSRDQTLVSCLSCIGRWIFFFFLMTEPPRKQSYICKRKGKEGGGVWGEEMVKYKWRRVK